MTDIDKIISERFQRSPTFDFGDNPKAAKANINDLIADTYKAQNAIAHGVTPYEAVRDNVSPSERGGAGVGYGITYDPKPYGAIVVTTAKDGDPDDKRTAEVTYDAAAATADRVEAKRAAEAAEAAAAKAAAKRLDEEGGVKHDAFFGDVTVRPKAERDAAKAALAAEEAAKAEERAAAAADREHFLSMDSQGRNLSDDLAAVEATLKRSDETETQESEEEEDERLWTLPTTDPRYPGKVNSLQYVMDQNAQQQKKKKGLFGRFKRSDINQRMEAWYQATQHPERASEFLKAYRARQYAGGIEDLEGIGNRAGQLDSVAKYGTTAYFDPIAPPAEYPVSDDPDVANGQISQAAYVNTFDYDHMADQRFDEDREREFVHGREAGNAMNGVGAEKPRVKTVEAMPSPYEFLNGEIEDVDVTEDVAPYYDYKGVKSAPGLMGHAKKGLRAAYKTGVPMDIQQADIASAISDFKESANSLLDSHLSGLQDRGYITRSQAEFAKAVFDDDETDAAVEDAAAEEGPDDFEAPGIKHMKDTRKERADAIKPVTSQVDKIRGAEEVGRNVGRGDVDPELTTMDVDVDLSSYIESLMDRGLIEPREYAHARQAFRDGFLYGVNDDYYHDPAYGGKY